MRNEISLILKEIELILDGIKDGMTWRNSIWVEEKLVIDTRKIQSQEVGRGNFLAALKSSEMTEPASVTWRDWPLHKIDKDKKPHNKQLSLIDMWDGPGRQRSSTYIKISLACGQAEGLVLSCFELLGAISTPRSTEREKRYTKHKMSSVGL